MFKCIFYHRLIPIVFCGGFVLQLGRSKPEQIADIKEFLFAWNVI